MSPPENETPAPGAADHAERPEASPAAATSPTLTDSPSRVAGSTAAPTFKPGEVVAGRYLVSRFVARGGMGEVFEVDDLELRERVALKTVRAEISAGDERAALRFRREIQLARKVTHPNVCRVYDVGFHEIAAPAEGGERGRIPFCTMELLTGETLARRLDARGPMDPDAALPLLAQMAAALDAAHDEGIVHRDFKSDNVFLVPGRRAGETRVVVTDFGMARATSRERFVVTLGERELMGTPAYMAPEQVEGGEVTAAADLYALGIVAYEMLTGTRPFDADTPLGTAMKRLKEPPPSPRVHRPELDARWESAILRCLERDPAARFRRAAELIAAIEPPSSTTTSTAGAPAMAARRSVLPRVAVGAAALAALAGVALIVRANFHASVASSPPPPPSAPAIALPRAPAITNPMPPPVATESAPARLRPSVAILGFKNLSGRADAAWLSTALSEMLATDLGAGQKLRLVPGENVARMKGSLSLTDGESLSPETLARIRGQLGNDFVVLGSYFAYFDAVTGGAFGNVRVDVRLQDAKTGGSLAVISETGSQGALPELAARLGAKLRQTLGAGSVSPDEARELRAAHSSSPAAERWYAEALAKLRLGEAEAARKRFEKSLVADPGFTLARAQLAEALFEIGYVTEAQAQARRALAAAAQLPREERLFVEARSHDMEGEHALAAETYGTLFKLYPDDLEYGLRFVYASLHAQKPAEARRAIEALRRLGPPQSEDPRIDVADSWAALTLGQHREAQAIAATAVSRARALGMRIVIADARTVEAEALLHLGELDRAAEDYDEVRRIADAASDQRGVYYAILGRSGVCAMRDDLACQQRWLGEALKVVRRSHDTMDEARTLASLSMNALARGDLGEARRRWAEAQHKAGAADTPEVKKAERSWVACTSLAIGDLAGSLSAFRAMAAEAHAIGNGAHEADARVTASIVLTQMGRYADAAAELDVARKLSPEREDGLAASRELALAWLAEARGQAAEAVEHAGAAANLFERRSARDHALLAQATRALALLRADRGGEAKAWLSGAAPGIAAMQRFEMRLAASLAAARVRAATGTREDASAALREAALVLSQASKSGFATWALEARLAMGEIARGLPGAADKARADLMALSREASARGYGRIAMEAEATASGKPTSGDGHARVAGDDDDDMQALIDAGRAFERAEREGKLGAKLRVLIEKELARQVAKKPRRKTSQDRADEEDGPAPPDPPDAPQL